MGADLVFRIPDLVVSVLEADDRGRVGRVPVERRRDAGSPIIVMRAAPSYESLSVVTVLAPFLRPTRLLRLGPT